MIEYPIFSGQLEIRQDGDNPIIAAKFPYGVTATVTNRGRARKERFAPGSMSWQVRKFQEVQQQFAEMIDSAMEEIRKEHLIAQLQDELEKRNTHLLVGHDYNRAIADMKTGTLAVRHNDRYVELEATLPPEERQPSWVRDAALAVEGGQLRGVSPGFNVTAQGAERLVPEDGPGDSLVREILDSVVFEYSLVARPSYPLTEVDARADDPAIHRGRRRWWM